MEINELNLESVINEYCQHKECFADVMNAMLFYGIEAVRPNHLRLRHIDAVSKDDYISYHRPYDVFMMHKSNTKIDVLGLEIYTQKVENIAKENLIHTMCVYYQSLEKDEEIFPVISYVLYCGVEPWSGVFNLSNWKDSLEEDEENYWDWKVLVTDVKDINVELLKNQEAYELITSIQSYLQTKMNNSYKQGL